jgi:WD40 repeat protein
VISGSYGEVKVWDLATGQLKVTLPNLPQWKYTKGPVTVWGDDPNRFNLRAMSEDGKIAIFDSISGQVSTWDLTTNQQKFPLKERFDGFAGSVLDAKLSPDGKIAAIQYSNSSKKFETRLKVWDLTTGTVIARGSFSFNRSTFIPLGIAVSRDRIFGSDRDQLKVWNLHTAELEAILDVPWMSSLVVSPDGKLLAGISGDSHFQDAKIQVLRHR